MNDQVRFFNTLLDILQDIASNACYSDIECIHQIKSIEIVTKKLTKLTEDMEE